MSAAAHDRIGPAVARVLATLMVVWAVALPVAPLAASARGVPAAGSAIVYAAGSLVCHQQPARSFSTRGRRWPVCARCAGIYLAAGLVGLAVVGGAARVRAVSARSWRRRFLVALLPIAVTWGLERLGAAGVSNGVRALSGVWLGATMAVALGSVKRSPGAGSCEE
jgi:uncharacterized membrane protein